MEAGNTIPVLKIKLEVIFLFNSISPNFRLLKVCFPIVFLFSYQIQSLEVVRPINNPDDSPPSPLNCHLLPSKLPQVLSVHLSVVSQLPGSVLVAGLLPARPQCRKEIAREQNCAFLGKPLPLEWRDMACHFYFVSPSKVSNNIARIRASEKRVLFKRRHLSRRCVSGKGVSRFIF